MKIVFLQLTACLFRNTSCRPPASSNSNIFPMLFTSWAQKEIEVFEFLLIFSILIHKFDDFHNLMFLFWNFTFNHFVSLYFPNYFHKFSELTSSTNYKRCFPDERWWVNNWTWKYNSEDRQSNSEISSTSVPCSGTVGLKRLCNFQKYVDRLIFLRLAFWAYFTVSSLILFDLLFNLMLKSS